MEMSKLSLALEMNGDFDSYLSLLAVMLGLYSKQGRIGMDTSLEKTYFNRWITRLIFSRERQMALQLDCFSLTMLQAIKSEHQMPYQLTRCPRICIRHGDTIKMDPE